MEKIPGLRVIGNSSFEEKEKAKNELTQRLYNHYESLSDHKKEVLKNFEKEKTVEQIQAIELVNHEINTIRKEMQLESFDIPAENYHIVDQEFYEHNFGENSWATMYFHGQIIFFNEKNVNKDLLLFASCALHESLHLQGHITLEVNNDENKGTRVTSFRKGVSVYSTQKKHTEGKSSKHFIGLQEAIVSQQEKNSFSSLIDCPLFEKEKENLFSEKAEKFKDELVDQYPNVQREEITFVSEDGKDFGFMGYKDQRKVLNLVCTKIFEKFPEQFATHDDVFKLFLKAQFTGQLLDIARLTEAVFGEGSFRILGGMNITADSATQTLESLGIESTS